MSKPLPGGWNPEQTQPLRSPPSALPSADVSLRVPSDIFGPYKLQRKIAESGVGELFQAINEKTKAAGILKRLRSDRAGSLISQRRFEFEMELGKLLKHANLVMVRDSGIINDRHYMFMDEVRGPSMRRILQGNAPWQVTTQGLLLAMEQIARGMAFVHRAGVVHCDLKPENVLFHSLKQPVVIDFGLAFRQGGPKPTKGIEDTRVSGYIMGTPMYMPPETITGQLVNATLAADVYSYGVMLYEVLAGRPPFVMDVTGNKQNALMKLIEEVVGSAPPPLRSIRPEIAEEWEVLCAACLEKKPSRRPQSLDRVAQDVGSIVRTGRPLPVAQKGLVRRITGWFGKSGIGPGGMGPAPSAPPPGGQPGPGSP